MMKIDHPINIFLLVNEFLLDLNIEAIRTWINGKIAVPPAACAAYSKNASRLLANFGKFSAP